MSIPLSLTVNGKAVQADVDPRTLLVDLLRRNLGLTGVHVGCDTGFCAANQSASARISSRVRSLAIGVICGSLRRPSWKSRSCR